MRIISIFIAVSLAAVAVAQQPDKTFVSAADVEAMIAKAKAERKPDQANFLQTLVRLAPYNVALEYRVAGVDTPATQHEKEAELIFVVDGAATFTTGGKLVDEKRTNPTNLSGTAVAGGSARRIAKGDYIFVPENTPHSFTKTEGRLVIMSVHMPRTANGG